MSLLDTNDLDPRLTPELLLNLYGIFKQTHITTVNDAHDMNAFIQTMKDVWIPQYFEMFESE